MLVIAIGVAVALVAVDLVEARKNRGATLDTRNVARRSSAISLLGAALRK